MPAKLTDRLAAPSPPGVVGATPLASKYARCSGESCRELIDELQNALPRARSQGVLPSGPAPMLAERSTEPIVALASAGLSGAFQ